MTAKIWNEYDCLLADLDGVIYEGKQAIEFAVEAISELQNAQVSIGYVTNNSSRRPEVIAQQLIDFGIATRSDQVIGSAQIGVELMSEQVPSGSKVLVVGGDGLRHRVTESGFKLVASADDNPAAVIQGFAPDVAWSDLAEAAFAIQRGAKWIATNQDWTLPQERGLAPGNGTLVSAVHTATGILPLVAGKPEPAIFNLAKVVLKSEKPLFVGDRIDTDITGANVAGMDSALVLTGVSTKKEVLGVKPEGRPKYILENLSQLLTAYVSPVPTKHGFRCGKAEVEINLNRVRVTAGDPKSIEALRAACAAIYASSTPIFGLDVEPELYE